MNTISEKQAEARFCELVSDRFFGALSNGYAPSEKLLDGAILSIYTSKLSLFEGLNLFSASKTLKQSLWGYIAPTANHIAA